MCIFLTQIQTLLPAILVVLVHVSCQRGPVIPEQTIVQSVPHGHRLVVGLSDRTVVADRISSLDLIIVWRGAVACVQ